MSAPSILAEQRGPVLHLTLNQPQTRNAISLAMLDQLQQALAQAEEGAGTANAVRVVVLRGAGGHFCAGADLKDMAEARARAMQRAADSPADALDPIAEVNARFGRVCAAFARSPLAIVAVLEGTVMGGGMGLACAADVAIASEAVSFRLPETSLGLVPAQIAPYLVERLGYSQAKRLAVTGGRINAESALALGLVHLQVATDALPETLSQVLAEITACAPSALAATKALMAQARSRLPEALIEEAAQAFSKAAQGPEGAEGVAAFIQKRKPQWAAA